jgi:argininosuccinate lyase
MNIEAALRKRIGPAGAKLHTARSRNDQMALDLRLYVKAEIAEVLSRLQNLQRVLLSLAEKPLAELQKFSPLFDNDVAGVFDIRRLLAQRRAIGAPSPENITEQINRWRLDLGKGD